LSVEQPHLKGKRSEGHLPRFLIAFIVLFLGGFVCEIHAQDSASDSISTPFRKGRWLSGLNGSFSSATLKVESTENLISNNAYGLGIFTGTFIKDRWFVGFNIFAESSSGRGLIDRETEALLIGPSATYYFLDETYGSLYLSVLPGYLRVRESNSFEFENQVFRETFEGPGFGARMRLGFAYVISDRIVLDVGVGSTLAWVETTFSSDIRGNSRNQSIFSNSTFFTFGFNVLLDEFFF
jgi:hypothetical protein